MVSIYALEKSGHPHETTSTPDAEESLLIGNHAVDVQQTFKRALDHELQKICNFYARKEGEIYEEASAVRSDLETFRHERDSDSTRSDSLYLPGSQEYGNTSRRDGSTGIFKSLAFGRPRRSSTLSSSYAIRRDGDDLDAMDDVVPLARARTSLDQSPARDAEIRSSIDDLRASRDTIGSIGRSRTIAEDYSERSFPALFESTVILKKRIISVYVSLCELKSFVQLNRTGFAKALKKFDKLLDRDFRPVYMQDSVGPARPFRKETMDVLDEELTEIEKTYAEVSTKGDVRQARSELRLHLREYVVWERNTVWREMIGMERKADAARLGRRPTILTGPYDQSQVQRQGDETPPSVTRELDTPLGKVRFPQWAFGHNSLLLLGILACFIILLSVPILQKAEQQNCLAMLVLVSLLWATEVGSCFLFRTSKWTECSQRLVSCSGDTPFRDVVTGSFSGRDLAHCALRSKAPFTTRPEGGHIVHLLVHVEFRHHAPVGRFYHCGRLVEISDCPGPGHIRAGPSGRSTQSGSLDQHVGGHGRQHVHQQRRCPGVILFHHPGRSKFSIGRVECGPDAEKR